MIAKPTYFFVADGYEPLDLAGPASIFTAVNAALGEVYSIRTVALNDDPVRPGSGPRILPDSGINSCEPPHTLVIVGGFGMRRLELGDRDIERLRYLADGSERILTVCTGAFVAGRLGLLDGRKATTHWRYIDRLQARFPDADVQSDRLYVEDGPLWSAAGVTSGIDAALAIVKRDHGAAIAASVARQMVVYLHRQGGQTQYAEDLRLQEALSGRFAELIEWARSNLNEDLSISALAHRVSMSERTFQRRFKADLGASVSAYIERLRIHHARELLTKSDTSVASVGRAVGFSNPDTFTRAFERLTQVSPSFYRKRFSE